MNGTRNIYSFQVVGQISREKLEQLKAVNDQVINIFIRPEPLSGSYTDFYKTSNPLSDFWTLLNR